MKFRKEHSVSPDFLCEQLMIDDQTNSRQRLKADAVFLKALGFEDEKERKSFVDQACKGDEALRLEVNDMIASLAAMGDFLEDSSSLTISARDLYDTLATYPRLVDQ